MNLMNHIMTSFLLPQRLLGRSCQSSSPAVGSSYLYYRIISDQAVVEQPQKVVSKYRPVVASGSVLVSIIGCPDLPCDCSSFVNQSDKPVNPIDRPPNHHRTADTDLPSHSHHYLC